MTFEIRTEYSLREDNVYKQAYDEGSEHRYTSFSSVSFSSSAAPLHSYYTLIYSSSIIQFVKMLILAFSFLGLSFLRPASADIQPKFYPDCVTDGIADRSDYGVPPDFSSLFCAMQFNQGHFVSGVETWTTQGGNKVLAQLNGIKVSYTSGETTFVGFDVGDHAQLSWDPAQANLKHADAHSYYQNLLGKYAEPSGIFIKLTDGRVLQPPGSPSNAEDGPGDISGTLLGISGHVNGDHIDQISFHTLAQTVTGAHIHDVVFSPTTDELNSRKSNE
jgi:hypothetical protein